MQIAVVGLFLDLAQPRCLRLAMRYEGQMEGERQRDIGILHTSIFFSSFFLSLFWFSNPFVIPSISRALVSFMSAVIYA